jgi:hypothetical protein
MKIVLTSYGDISDVVQKDDILFLVSQLSENQEVSEEFSIRIADPDGSIETFLTQMGVYASIEVYDDQNTLISTYYFTGRYERTQDFYFVDAFFRKEIIPADATAGRTGFFDINLLFSRVFGVSRQDILLPGATNYAYLNIYDTIPEIPVSGYSGVSMATYGDYVFIAHQNVLIRYQKSTKTYQAFTIPQYPGYTKPSRQEYFRQDTAPIQAKILGFRVESGIPYIYILTDEIYYLATGALAGFYTVRKFRADFTNSPSYVTVKEKLFSPDYAVGITNAMLCDLSTVIPMGVQSSSGNFDYLVWLQVKKDTSSATASTVKVYLMDMNFTPGSPVATIQADLRQFDQTRRRYSDSYFWDSTKWAVVWNCFLIVKWGTSYHARQISANQNCGDVAVFYDQAQNRFRAYFEAGSRIIEIQFSGTFTEDLFEGFMIGGRNARISWRFFQSIQYEILETQLGGVKSMSHVGLSAFDLGYIYSDVFVGFIDSYAVVGFIQSQPNVSVYVNDANTKLLSLAGEVKRILADAIIYDPTTKQFYSTSSRAPSGTITQDDYSQYREEAFTRKNMSCLVSFADGYTGRLPYEEKTLELSTMYAFQGWHLFSTFTRWKKYEILSPRSDLSVGLVYTFTDQEGRSVSALVKKKLLEFSSLWRYELVTLEYPTTIDYQLPQDEPSWLVLDTDFSHGLTRYGTHFEHLAKISWRSLGVEPPLRVYITVIDTYTGDVVVDEWSFISRSGTYYIRWTASKLTNYTVNARFVSAHDVDEYSWNITYLAEAEPKKSAPLTDIVEEYTEGIFSNRNATFDLKDEGWTIEGDHEWLYDWTDTNGLFHKKWTLKLSSGAKIRSKTYPLRAYTSGANFSVMVRIYAYKFLGTTGPDLRVKLVGIDVWGEEYVTYKDSNVSNTLPVRFEQILTVESANNLQEYYIEVENISGTDIYLRGIGIFEPPYALYSQSAIDSDTVDGRHASEFPLLSGSNTFTGSNTFRTVSITPQTTSETPLTVKSLQTTAPLGSELVQNGTFDTDQYWTWGTGWIWDSTNYEADHQTGNTAPLTQNITVQNGQTYIISFTLRNTTAGSVSVSVGSVNIENYAGVYVFNANGTYIRSFVANTTGAVTLAITPTSTFNGSIDNVSVKQITGTLQPHISLVDADGGKVMEIVGGSNTNFGIGFQVMPKCATGSYNTAYGSYALYSLTTGSQNTAIGRNALYSNTIGNNNTAIGFGALNSNISGDENVAIGNSAMSSCTTGRLNVAIGGQSLYSLTTGYSNVAIGRMALYSLTTGYQNIAVGQNAGRYVSGGSPNQTSTNSVYLGTDTRALSNGDTNEIVIGHQAIGGGSNSVVIGNDSITKTYLKGKLAIGYTGTLPSPHSYLQPNGSVAFPITTTNANLTLTDAHYTVLVDASGGSRTITLPSASGIDGRIYVVKKIDDSANAVVVQAQTGQAIDGSNPVLLTNQFATVIVQAYGGNWYIVSYYGGR